jgi:hypothetical protein
MPPKMAKREYPPKFAIANRFVIGSFPQRIEFYSKDSNKQVRTIKDNDLTDLVKAILTPILLYGSVFSYSGGAQKSTRGNYQFFEMDQNRHGGVMNQLNKAGIGEHIYCVLCRRMTPVQKQIVHKRSKVNTQLCICWGLYRYGN